jgi:Ras family
MQTPTSSCYVLPWNRKIHLKTYEKNGTTKSLDIVKVSSHHSALLVRVDVGKRDMLIVGVKLCLVALKCDLRDDDRTKERLAKYGEKCITYEEGLAMAKQIRAVRYLGTSPFSRIFLH